MIPFYNRLMFIWSQNRWHMQKNFDKMTEIHTKTRFVTQPIMK